MNFKSIFLVLFVAITTLICQGSARLYQFNGGRALLRNKRDHHGVTGPVHTFVKTDKHANFKWGVRHHVGHQYSG